MTDISFCREMGFTRAEFLRILPAALSKNESLIDENGANVTIVSGVLQLDIGEQKYRRIASISLPYIDVNFSFTGLQQSQVDEFMRFFDLRYQRGGG